MSDEFDGVTLVAPLRETGPAPAPAFSVDAAVTRVRTIRRRRGVLLAAAAAVVVAAGAVVVSSVPWPFQGPALTYPLAAAPQVSVRLVPVDRTDLVLPHAPVIRAGDQLIEGTVTWSPPPHSKGMIVTLYLIDKRTNTMPISWTSPDHAAVTIGSNSSDDVIAHRYPWLSMFGAVQVGDVWTRYWDEISAPASLGTITFVALFLHSDAGTAFPGHYALAPVDVSDLTLAVVYHDADGYGGWAVRVDG
jgi:hypothetical protein